ncbi:MAG TPA: hypothetical protein VF411_09205 [Bacteroidia bacterium]
MEFKLSNPDERDYEIKRGKKVYKNPENQFRVSLVNIERITENDFWMSVDDSGNRFHSNITNMNSKLRNHLTYNGETLGAIDLSNSQPYLSSLLLREAFWMKNSKSNTPNIYNSNMQSLFNNQSLSIMLVKVPAMLDNTDVYKFIDLVVRGKLYEFFAQKYYDNENFALVKSKDRRIIKDIVFSVLYSENCQMNKGKRLFKSLFPNVYGVFSLIKESGNEKLPILLQKLESDLFLKRIAKRISKENPNTPIYTIHDNIATTLSNLDYISKVVYEECYKYTGLKPTLKKEIWAIGKLEGKRLAA